MNSLTKTYNIEISNVDANFNVTPKYIMEMLQDIATDHANLLGFGWHALRRENKVWVISKIKFQHNIAPNTEKLKLTTWPLVPSRFFAQREFVGRDEQDNIVLRASSLWCLLDLETRRIINPHSIDHLYSGPYLEETSWLDGKWEKLAIDDSYSHCYTRTIRWTDLDMNRHVNNTNYTLYAMDCIDDVNFNKSVSAMEVTFHNECHLGDNVEIFANKSDGLRCVGVMGDKVCFTAKVVFDR